LSEPRYLQEHLPQAVAAASAADAAKLKSGTAMRLRLRRNFAQRLSGSKIAWGESGAKTGTKSLSE
jgi:hypothetical protein